MKVLLVITKSGIGGAQAFVLKLAQALKNSGVNVEVAGGEGEYLFEELKKLSICFHHIKSLKRNISLINSARFVFDLYRFIKNRQYDVIHLNSSNALVGALSMPMLKRKPKVLFTFHGLSFLDEHHEMNRVYKYFTKIIFRNLIKLIDVQVFVSHNNYEKAKKEKIIKSGIVIQNGLEEKDLSFYNGSEARKYLMKEYNIDLKGSYLVGSVGRLVYPKNYEFLIHNYQKIKSTIPNIKIIIIGDGSNYLRYKKLIERNKYEKDFILLGAIKNSYKYIKAFDVFTLPSVYEGLSISIIEALYAGLPILASDIDGNREVLNNDNRQVYEFNNIDDYIKKLIYIKENSKEIIEYNLSLTPRFSLEKMAAEYKALYDKLVCEK